MHIVGYFLLAWFGSGLFVFCWMLWLSKPTGMVADEVDKHIPWGSEHRDFLTMMRSREPMLMSVLLFVCLLLGPIPLFTSSEEDGKRKFKMPLSFSFQFKVKNTFMVTRIAYDPEIGYVDWKEFDSEDAAVAFVKSLYPTCLKIYVRADGTTAFEQWAVYSELTQQVEFEDPTFMSAHVVWGWLSHVGVGEDLEDRRDPTTGASIYEVMPIRQFKPAELISLSPEDLVSL